MLHGMINVYKEAGFTSHDVVAKLRGIVGQKKIGHTGTLDPEAVGVLPVCLGSATKLCELLTEKKKSYRAVMLLGRTTDTQDTSGQTIEEREVSCTDEEIQTVMGRFLGAGLQVPPMYSALKIGGKRLYELAREGKEVKREPRPVTFYELRFLSRQNTEVCFEVTCSKGTYIRTLCADIGEALGCGACMKELIRYRVDRFCLEDAKTLAELERLSREGRIQEALLPVDTLFSICPSAQVTPAGERYLKNGNPLTEEQLETWEEPELQQEENPERGLPESVFSKEGLPEGIIRVYDSEGCFQALYQRKQDSKQREAFYQPWKTFFQT